MARYFRFLIPIYILFHFCADLSAQDPIYSQFYAAPLQLNPAFAGNAFAPFIAVNYRSQFSAFNGGAAYSTYSVSYDQFLEGLNSGIGISIMNDDAGQGIYKKTYASVDYSYKIKINENLNAKMGIQAGLIQSNLDWTRLIFSDQLDAQTGPYNNDGSTRPSQETKPQNNSNSNFDVSTGFLVYGTKFYGGFTAKHLTTPYIGFKSSNAGLIGIPIQFNVHAGYEFTLSEATRSKPSSYVTPNIMVVKQADFTQIVGGAYTGIGPVFAGAWMRYSGGPESVIALIGFRQDYFKIGYSYDYTISGLSGKTGGTHEISFTVNLDPFRSKFDINDCFQMFR